MSSKNFKENDRQGCETSVWPEPFTRRRALKGNLDEIFVDRQRHDFKVKGSEVRIFFKDTSISCLDFQALQEQFQGVLEKPRRGRLFRTGSLLASASITFSPLKTTTIESPLQVIS